MFVDIIYSVHIVATAAWLSNEEGASDAVKCARAHEISEQMDEDMVILKCWVV